MPKKTKAASQSFESRMQRLQEIVQKLESGEVSLEESIALYKEGMACSTACRLQLHEARNVLTLVQDDSVRPFENVKDQQDDKFFA